MLVDTSILFPAQMQMHDNHRRCRQLVDRLLHESSVFVLSTHLLAEMYANMTRYPPGPIRPDLTLHALQRLHQLTTLVNLDVEDYFEAMERCASKGLISGVIFDALHLQAAIKAEAD